MEYNHSPSALMGPSAKIIRRMQYMMGCFVEIEVDAYEDNSASKAIEVAFHEMKRIENLLSRFNSDSETSRINELAGIAPVHVSDEVFGLLKTCLIYSKLTDGAFDITMNPLNRLWENAEKQQRLPEEYDIRATLASVGHEHIVLDREQQTVYFSRPGMQVDFGAIGKGYAVDRAVECLQTLGVSNGLVSTGSNIHVFGDEESRFGIKNPLMPEEVLTSVSLDNNSISTSAAYERYYEINGISYGHVICPKLGTPVQNDLLSVSITGPNAMECDILSTATFVLGANKSKSLMYQFPKYYPLVITANNLNSFKIGA